MARQTKTQKAVKRAFHEVHENSPQAVERTFYKKGPARAEKQRVAIALNKARRGGARIPKAPRKK